MDKVNFLFYDILHASSNIKLACLSASKDVSSSFRVFKLYHINLYSDEISVLRLWTMTNRQKHDALFSVFRRAITLGLLQLCQFLFAKGLVDLSGMRKKLQRWEKSIVEIVAENGHVHILQFLKDIGFSRKDARAHGNHAFHYAAINGRGDVLKFLKDEWGMTSNDARAHVERTLRFVGAGGHLAVLRILKTDFGLTADDVRRSDVLSHAVCCGHLEMCQFIKEWLTQEQIKVGELDALTKSGQKRLQRHERALSYRRRVELALEDSGVHNRLAVSQFLRSWLAEL